MTEEDWADKATIALAELSALLRKEHAARLRGLYVIADPEIAGSSDLAGLIAAALQGGAKAVQLRDKHSDKGDQLPLAKTLAQMCRHHDALLFINDHADLAVAANADGIHVGQHDLPVEEARKSLLPHQLVGTSNALVDEAHASIGIGADYLAVGAMFPTKTKLNTRPAGVETLRMVRHITDLPIVAIGGINATNVAEVVQAGADAICVTSAILAAEDPEAASAELVEIIEKGLATRREA
ncbi:MAG: thiamine-phosphate pyrophosphorylase [Chloroflexi bacterium]|jgi:thiamine-phosphate diphosphorylase|nr:MAG: thiamine-phosphate pyrophosphorylase [Chloroflexota bacterium]